MAIIKTYLGQNKDSTIYYSGRVIRIELTTERRNWSDTLDVSDFRSTECTYALVWLGTHGIPTSSRNGRPMAEIPSMWSPAPRELEFFEQFGWVDCTNLHSDRCGYRLEATADSDMEPLMMANLIAWQAYEASVAARALEAIEQARIAREAAEEAERQKRAVRAAKKEAKEATLKAEAEALLVHAPDKGTTVTVNGFTGKVFWTGVSKYYGKWNARVGVKDTKGIVQWIDASHWVTK